MEPRPYGHNEAARAAGVGYDHGNHGAVPGVQYFLAPAAHALVTLLVHGGGGGGQGGVFVGLCLVRGCRGRLVPYEYRSASA